MEELGSARGGGRAGCRSHAMSEMIVRANGSPNELASVTSRSWQLANGSGSELSGSGELSDSGSVVGSGTGQW